MDKNETPDLWSDDAEERFRAHVERVRRDADEGEANIEADLVANLGEDFGRRIFTAAFN